MPKLIKHILIKLLQSFVEVLFVVPLLLLIGVLVFSEAPLTKLCITVPISYTAGVLFGTFIKNKSNYFYIFASTIIITLISVLLLRDAKLFTLLASIAFLTFLMFRGIKISSKSWSKHSPAAAFSVFIAIYFISFFVFLMSDRYTPYLSIVNAGGIASMFVFLIICNFDQLKLAFYKNAEKNYIPVSLLKFNIVFIFVAFILIAFITRFKPFWDAVLLIVKGFVFLIYTLISKSFISSSSNSDFQDLEMRLFNNHTSDLNILAMVWNFLRIIVSIAFVILMIYILFKVIENVMKWISKNSPEKEIKDNVLGYTDEKVSISKERSPYWRNLRKILFPMSKEASWNDLKSNNERVRYLYVQMILKFIKNGFKFKSHLTPSELGNELSEKYKSNINDLTSIYNKARYSNEDISDHEMNDVRNIAGHRKE